MMCSLPRLVTEKKNTVMQNSTMQGPVTWVPLSVLVAEHGQRKNLMRCILEFSLLSLLAASGSRQSRRQGRWLSQ